MLASRIARFTASSSTGASRYITKSMVAPERALGLGGVVHRAMGIRELWEQDPFLALDEFKVGPKGGFPDHPHRGFETVTYMLKGHMKHEDFAGHKGTIGPGDLQWMTAGQAIVHAEMPIEDPKDLAEAAEAIATYNKTKKEGEPLKFEDPSLTIHGLQLWVNLSPEDKKCDPQYQDLRDDQIPRVEPKEGVLVKVIAGEAHGVKSKVYTRTLTTYLDYKMDKNRSIEISIPRRYNGFLYMLSGKAFVGGAGEDVVGIETSKSSLKKLGPHTTLNDRPLEPFEGLPHHLLAVSGFDPDTVWGSGSGSGSSEDEMDTLLVETKDEGAHFLVYTGLPLNKPVARSAFFVMNSEDEVEQALQDFRNGVNGFEKAKTWTSSIAPRGFKFKI